MSERLTGALFSYETHFLYVGPLIASARHKHHAGQVMWVPDGVVIEDERRCERRVTLHTVPPHQPHSHGAASIAAVLWVDREGLRWDRASTPSVPDSFYNEPITPKNAHVLARTLLEVIAPASDPQAQLPQHIAVRRMCSLLDNTASDREISLTQLARQAGLSVRQLRHRFTRELGLNPSAYLRWRRIRRAVTCIGQGASLTQAALEAGFADGAHFSRVFQAQFGMAPSQALSSVHFAGPLT